MLSIRNKGRHRPDAAGRKPAPGPRHWKLLLYWPFYILAYWGIGLLGGRVAPVCVSTALDRAIPFDARFILPYLLWFPFWIGTLAYAFFREPRLFRRLMHFFMLSFSTAVFLFWLVPTTPGLRPDPVPGGGLCAELTRFVYWIDADVNCCPSEHIIGLYAVVFAVWDSEFLSTPLNKCLAVLVSLVIAASTVLVKQHALVDLAAASALSIACGLLCFYLPKRRARRAPRHP